MAQMTHTRRTRRMITCPSSVGTCSSLTRPALPPMAVVVQVPVPVLAQVLVLVPVLVVPVRVQVLVLVVPLQPLPG